MAATYENPPKVLFPETSITDPDLEGLIVALENGSLTSEILTKTYIARIAEVNETVSAVSQVNPDAVDDAIQLDKERRSGKIRGHLHGIPVLLKDTIGTLDKLETTAGSLALVGARPSAEAGVVKQLRNSGAIILGKTTITQWGNTRSVRAPNGWSSTSGQCYGPFYEKQDPRGSSSGCAVAAAMGLAAVTIGGETWGSIIAPAQANCVVGLKPTVGLVSRAGVVPISAYKDTIGPIVRTVKDAAIVLREIAGVDPSDEATQSIPFDEIPDYIAVCTVDALADSRIAVSSSVLAKYKENEVKESFNAALEVMKSLGATIVNDVDFEDWKPGSGQRENMTANVFLRDGLETYFGQLAENPHGIKTMADLIDFMERTPEEETENLEALERMKYLGADITRLLDRANCDALVFPTSADVPFDLGQNPVISVPLGYYSENQKVLIWESGVGVAPNIPYSLSFAGRKFSEEKLIALAYAFEQATLVQRKAKFFVRATVQLPIMQPDNSCTTHL